MIVRISPMRYEDIAVVQEIEHQVFPSPWSRATFEREIGSPEFHRLVVAKTGDRLVGYACLFHVIDEGHITNIGVDPEYQNQGIGTKLMYNLVCYALHKGVQRLMLEVRPSNAAARHLYREFGFFRTGIRKGYYTDTGEDAYIYWTEDIRSDHYRKNVLEKIARKLENGAA